MTTKLNLRTLLSGSTTQVESCSEDVTLARKCVVGDQRAQRTFYDKYCPMVLGICRRYSAFDLEDTELLSQVFIRAFDKLGTYNGDGSLGAWLRSLTVRTCLSAIRKRSKHRYESIESADKEISLTTQALDLLALEDLVKLVRTLPDIPRIIFNLHVVEGYKHSEIAEQLGLTEANSRYHLRQAKLRLRSLIEIQMPDYE
ncbi:MAG: sigma-70 family RNA polymerase sigma factor [Bacteroidota bacterium]